ncbi:MAG: phosphoenolpyruvate synthase, partial [Methanobrevibacter sp.]|nr:phosphoenolpyruvate synthase [Methanobrevibacter sp.]
MYVKKFEDLSKDDLGIAGGKGANLGELTQAGIPVPPGFVVTSKTYDKFMRDTGIFSKVMDILDQVDINNTKELQEAAEEIKAIIIETPIPDGISTYITEAYNQLSERVGEEDGADVAIRSSATAEDLPEASFAGQQDTFLHVQGLDNVIEYVRKCWASLFEARAIFYREENNFEHSQVYIAVVVQQMVDSDKAGVMFTVNPSTGENIALIEGSWGLGESVVSGSVTPDNYAVDKETNEILNVTISDKKTMFTNEEGGTSIQVDVPEDLRKERVLSDEELLELVAMAKRVEGHYGKPQDTEWAFHDGNLFLLQSRPITTLGDSKKEEAEEEVDLEVLIRGLGASPGLASGTVKVILSLDELDKVQDGDVMVTTMTTPDMVPAMKRATGIVTDEGGVTCHAAIISRELGIPCVVGTGDATTTLKENDEVTADGKKGLVYKGIIKGAESEEATAGAVQVSATPLITVTEVKANVSMAEAAPKAAATGADGVGLLRTEHMMLSTGVHPRKFILDGEEDKLVDTIAEGVLKVADEFYPKPVWYRTLDAPTDEFITLEGGENEPREHNPMLGWRGIRRELDEPEILKAEFKAIKKLHDKGYTNIGIMIPLSQHPSELRRAKELCREVGMEPQVDVEFGMMVEIPAAAILIDEYIAEGIDFVSLGTNDLTQYTLAVDRNNEFVAKHYREEHPAVMALIERTIKHCAAAGVTCSICGQAGSVPHIVEKLVKFGIT